MTSFGEPLRLREERKVVTALFADLVGSTTIGERFDPEDTRDIISGGVALMIEAVERFGAGNRDFDTRTFAELLIHAEEDPALRAVLVGILSEADR